MLTASESCELGGGIKWQGPSWNGRFIGRWHMPFSILISIGLLNAFEIIESKGDN